MYVCFITVGQILRPARRRRRLTCADFRRVQLSQIVNGILGTEKAIPLEFIINGQFLRTDIETFLNNNGISAESLLTVEYVRAILPPTHVASYQHDDWVSAVDVSGGSGPGQERILSGCMDGHLRVWNTSNQCIATSAANEAAVQGMRGIKSARWITDKQIASGGYDRVVRVWSYEDTQIKPHIELYGHRSSINHIATHGKSDRILSASSDHTVGVWSTKRSEKIEAPENLVPRATNKRQKLSSAGAGIQTAQRGPVMQLRGHTDQVMGVAFHPDDATAGYSAGYDRTLRTWDLTTGVLVDTRTVPGGQAVWSICATKELGLVACGTAGRGANIAMIDPRANATSTVAMLLKGHSNPVSSIDVDPDSKYGLVSGSYDSTCKVWDLRSSQAGQGGAASESVYTISREGKASGDNKVLDVCWNKDVGIVAGGEDSRVQINKGGGT